MVTNEVMGGGGMTITSIADIVRTHGRERPDAPALEFEGRTITFGELDAAVEPARPGARGRGRRARRPVAFLDKNGPEYFEVTFALAKLNAVNVGGELAAGARPRSPRSSTTPARRCSSSGPSSSPHIEKIEADLATVSTIVAIGGHARWHDYEALLGRSDADRSRRASRRATTSRSSSTRRAPPACPRA